MSDNPKELLANIAPFGLRMQAELKERIKEAAEKNNRSLNAEIVARVEVYDAIYANMAEAVVERDKLAAQLEATREGLAEQKRISAGLQHVLSENFDEAKREEDTENVIEERFNELKAQSEYLEALKVELLELSKERQEIDHDKDKLIAEQSKVIDHLSEANGQAVSLIRRLKLAIDAAARGDRSLIDRFIESARDNYHYDDLLPQNLAKNQDSEE
jgi:vacuolar-type H+-ATPase subunit I/STV1